MEEKKFLENLKRFNDLFLEYEKIMAKRAFSYQEQMEKDGMYGKVALEKEDMLIEKRAYLENKLGRKLSSITPTKTRPPFILLAIGIALTAIGIVANFYLGTGLGVVALLISIKSFRNNILYKKNKSIIDETSQEYDELKTKWLKIIKEDEETLLKNKKEQESLIPELMEYVKTLDIPTTLGDITTLLILNSCIQQHNGKINEAMDDCKEEIKKSIIKKQCENCVRKNYCGERNSVYNCSNFVKNQE